MTTEKRPSLFGRAATLVAAMFVALMIGELVARGVCFTARVLDPDFGYVIADGATTRWAIEGNGTGHWGARGVRGTWARSSSSPPILVIGDSMTEAAQVDDDETFSARAQAELESRGRKAQLLNVGLAGARTPMYVAQAAAERRVFGQTWTVVAINDDDLERDMFVQNGSYFTEAPDGSLTLHEVPAEGTSAGRMLYRKLRWKSALAQLAALQANGFLTDAADTRGRMFHMGRPRVYPPPAPASTFPIQAALTELEKAYDHRLMILFLSGFDPAAPSKPSDVELEVMKFCDHAPSCVFARNAWPDFARRKATPYGFPNRGWNFGHPNVEGHRAIGHLLAEELARLSDRDLL